MDVGGAPLNAAERAATPQLPPRGADSRGYRAHLERLGVDHRNVTRHLPGALHRQARRLRGRHREWLEGGRVADAAELLTSSGQTGLFSVGVTSRSERRAQERTLD